VGAMPQIFLCYAREDEAKVEKLYQKLSDAGFNPWMAKKDLLPGEQWKSRIPQAIRGSDFFVVCLSAISVNKRSFIQKEIKDGLDIWKEKLNSDIYLIPVRLEDCEVPESLRSFHWVNLFEVDGWTRLVKAIQIGMERRPKQVPYFDYRYPDPAPRLAEAQGKLREQEAARHEKMLEFYEKGSEHYQSKKWKDAVDYLEKASAIEPNHADLPIKLGEARKRLRRQHVIRITLGMLSILNVAIFTIAPAIFPGRFAAAGNSIEEWWRGIRVTPMPTVAIPGIARIEVYMDGDQLDMEELPSLTGGQPVELEIIVLDTNGRKYTSDDLGCKWSVNPLGDNDERIDTELCRAPYTPSQEYSQQVVILQEVEGLEQQFEPIDPIPMTFDIK
jgi:tetratricopeptide (TPR) repeat protein